MDIICSTDSCSVPKHFVNSILSCYDFYSEEREEKIGWDASSNANSSKRRANLCPENWKYRSKEELGDHESLGVHALYGGGGYVANLGYDGKAASWILNDLAENEWIDRQTRVVMVELSTFNVATKLLADTTLYFEMLPSGFLGTSTKIKVIPLVKSDSASRDVYLVSFLVFAFFLGYYIISECTRIIELKCLYFLSIWNWLELLQFISALLVMASSIQREIEVLLTLQQLKTNPFAYVRSDDTLLWSENENGVICIAVTVAVLRLLRVLKFNSHVIILLSSMNRALRPVLSFTVLFAIIFIAYGHAGFLLFGKNVYMFSSLKRVAVSQFLMCLGSPGPRLELEQVDRTLARLYYQSFLLLTIIILINLFVAILNEAQTEATTSSSEGNDDIEVANLLLSKFLNFLGINREQSPSANEEDNASKESARNEVMSPMIADSPDKTRNQVVSAMRDNCAEKTASLNGLDDPLEPPESSFSKDGHALRSFSRNSLNGQTERSESSVWSFHGPNEPMERHCSLSSEAWDIPAIQRNSFDGRRSELSQFLCSSKLTERCEGSPDLQHSSWKNNSTLNDPGSSPLFHGQNEPTETPGHWLSPVSSTLSLASGTPLQEQRKPSLFPRNSPSPDMDNTSSTSTNSFDVRWDSTNAFPTCRLSRNFDLTSTNSSFDEHSEPERPRTSFVSDTYVKKSQLLEPSRRPVLRIPDGYAMSSTPQNSLISESPKKTSASIAKTEKGDSLDTALTVHFTADRKVRDVIARTSGSDSVVHPHFSLPPEHGRGRSHNKTYGNNGSPDNRSGGTVTSAQTSKSSLKYDKLNVQIIDFDEVSEWIKKGNICDKRSNIASLCGRKRRHPALKGREPSHPKKVDFDEISRWMKRKVFATDFTRDSIKTNVSPVNKGTIADLDAFSKVVKKRKTAETSKQRDTMNTTQLEIRVKRLDELLQVLDLWK